MRHNKVTDGVKNLDPVTIGLFHASEQAGILQGNRGMPSNRLKELLIFCCQRLSAVR